MVVDVGHFRRQPSLCVCCPAALSPVKACFIVAQLLEYRVSFRALLGRDQAITPYPGRGKRYRYRTRVKQTLAAHRIPKREEGVQAGHKEEEEAEKRASFSS